MNASSSTLFIREDLAQANVEERHIQTLDKLVTAAIPRLHKLIHLPPGHERAALLEFLNRYIEQAPAILEQLRELIDQADLHDSAGVFVDMAEEFYLRPPEAVRDHRGLHGALDKAYLVYRLLEEINDQLILLTEMRLAPVDLTFPNLIVHQLLGEHFANRLDSTVYRTVEALFSNPTQDFPQNRRLKRFLTDANRERWQQTLKDWPSMTGAAPIHMLTDYPAAEISH